MVAVFQRVPVEAGALAALDMVGAEMVPVFVNGNLGTAAYWAGDLVAAERHLAAAMNVRLLWFCHLSADTAVRQGGVCVCESGVHPARWAIVHAWPPKTTIRPILTAWPGVISISGKASSPASAPTRP